MNKREIIVETKFNTKHIDMKTLYLDGDEVTELSRKIVNLEEESIRKALVVLGWTPPGDNQ